MRKVMVYSVDLREKAVSLVENGKPKAEVAELLEIGIATLYRWLRKKAEGKSLEPLKNVRFVRKIDPKMLEEYVKKHPAGRDETKPWIRNKLNLVSTEAAKDHKKKKTTLYRERSREDRQKFIEEIAKIDHSSIVYIDEAGVDNRLYREYARAPRGEKVYAW